MHTPDCEGYVKIDDNKRYLAVKNGLLCYYNNDNVSLILCYQGKHVLCLYIVCHGCEFSGKGALGLRSQIHKNAQNANFGDLSGVFRKKFKWVTMLDPCVYAYIV